MDRTFEFNIREHIYSIPSMLIEFVDTTLEKCWEIVASFDFSSLQRIYLIGHGSFYAAALSLATYMESSTKIPVIVLSEDEAHKLVSDSESEFKNTLAFDIFPSFKNQVSVSIMDQLQEKEAYVICITSHHPYVARMHACTVLNLTIPSMRTYLPVRDYAISALALAAFSCIIDPKYNGKSKKVLESISSEINNDSFLLTQMLNRIDSAVLDHAKNILQEKEILFIGDDMDSAPAYLSTYFLSKYALRSSRLLKTTELLNNTNLSKNSNIILYSSMANRFHDDVKAIINSAHIHANTFCIVTDDPSIVSTQHYNVIHTPLVNRISSGLFTVVVPSLLAGYLFH